MYIIKLFKTFQYKKQEKTMYKLSDEALGAVMMALQKSLMEQSDIVPVLQNFNFETKENKLFVTNPPVVNLGKALDLEDEEA